MEMIVLNNFNFSFSFVKRAVLSSETGKKSCRSRQNWKANVHVNQLKYDEQPDWSKPFIKQIKKPNPCITAVKHGGHLITRGKCWKHKPWASVFYKRDDQGWSQDGWILAKFFFFLLLWNRERVEVHHKHTKANEAKNKRFSIYIGKGTLISYGSGAR